MEVQLHTNNKGDKMNTKEENKILDSLDNMAFNILDDHFNHKKVDYNNLDIMANIGKTFFVNKEELTSLVKSFLKYKKQKDKKEQDLAFLERLPEDGKYKFSLFQYSRTAFYDSDGHGVMNNLLYQGGVSDDKRTYVSRTIHWGNQYLKQIIKFQISMI